MPVEASQTLREGRAIYFDENGIPADGGYDDSWVVIKAMGVPVFAFPNTEGRKRDVPYHDIHHILTGYATDFIGEAEIAAWELGSDCRKSPAALFLNTQMFGSMLPLYPRRLFKAFVRGRHARNLYGTPWDEAILARHVGEVREELDVDAEIVEPTAADRRAFGHWALRAFVSTTGPAAAILAWWIWW